MMNGILAISILAVYANTVVFVVSWGLKWSVLLVNWKKNRRQAITAVDDGATARSGHPAALTSYGAAFFSVHLPTHNEPPDIVIKTIDSILASHYDDFELLVIDNNTSDPDLWTPVSEHCLQMGPRVRFYHCMNVANAKAGALDIALGLRSCRSTHVVIVDADYTVDRDFLNRASDLLAHNEYDYIQFPQSYRGEGAAGLKYELGLYFATVSRAADAANTMLLTGTLSVIAVNALNTLGGWKTSTLTEDAEIGLQLHMRGFRGRYIGQSAGAGLLPFTFFDLEKQRERWIHGNFQVLARYFTRIMTVKKTYLVAILSQLSAWFAFLLIPMVFMLLIPLFAGYQPLSGQAAWALAMAAATIILDFVSRFVFIRLSGSSTKLAQVLDTFVVSWALAARSSMATFTGNLPASRIFHRTNKSLCDDSGVVRSISTTVVAIVGSLAVLQGLLMAQPSVVVAGILLALMLPFQWLTSRRLLRYR
ncbi:MAG: glycosyltransferase family 2 protein, partial [Advenella sp.]